MRVKTVPRQRILQNSRNVEVESEMIAEEFEGLSNKDEEETSKDMDRTLDALDGSYMISGWRGQSDNPDVNGEGKREALDYSTEALDMSIKRKDETTRIVLNHATKPGPSSCCWYSNLPLENNMKETVHEDRNNNLLSPTNAVHYGSIPGPSTTERVRSREGERNVDDDATETEAVNLCKKACQEEDATNPSGECDDRLKDTFLYKIMTDPTFLENIQKHKQARKYACQFCKQEFANDDELTEHMDVKKDETNQVVCCACRKTFAQKRYLRYHQRCHSDGPKFTCDICTKKYTRLDNLTRHNTFHMNPDKFACSSCEKTFARKDLLNKHLKCHENKYRFYCEACQKYFKGPLTLDNHKKIFHAVT